MRRALAEARMAGTTPTDRYALAARLLRAWARVAPADAWRWSIENEAAFPTEDDEPLSTVVLRGVVERSPAMAIKLVSALLAEDGAKAQRLDVVAGLTEALLASDHAAEAQDTLARWATDPKQPRTDVKALTNVGLFVASHESTRAAMDWLAALPDSVARDAALAGVAQEWSQHDAPAALAWNLKLDATGQSSQGLVGAWANRDAPAAAEWLQSHDQLPQSDALIHGFVFDSSLLASAPRAAAEWASLIRQDSLRTQSLSEVVAAWRKSDPAAADQFAGAPTESLSGSK